MKYYIAGPMSGIAQFNYPAFFDAAEQLRNAGYDVVSPAEMDSPEVQAAALASEEGNLSELADTGESWGDMLSADVKLIADDVDGVLVLPGWEKSRGARLEAFVAVCVQKPVSTINSGLIVDIPNFIVMKEIHTNVLNQGDVSRYEETA